MHVASHVHGEMPLGSTFSFPGSTCHLFTIYSLKFRLLEGPSRRRQRRHNLAAAAEQSRNTSIVSSSKNFAVFGRAINCAGSMAESCNIKPGTSQEKIVVPNMHGEKLVGVLYNTGSKKVVVCCHGFRSSKDEKTMRNLATALTSNGISTFCFDFAGNGESEGTFQYGHYRREADDLHSVIQFLKDRGYEIISVLGHSKGGNVVLLYASIYHDVPAVINASGRFDLKKGIAERIGEDFMEKVKKDGFIEVKDKAGNVQYQVTEESLMDRWHTDMHVACSSIDKNCRVLTIHGTSDDIIPVGDAFEFDKIIPNHKLHIVEGADHCYTENQTELASAILDFLRELGV